MFAAEKGAVLLVDDESDLRTILADHLAKAGYLVIQACDGMEALDILRDKPFGWQAVITDIKMPRVSGIELIITLHEVGLKFPAIIITSSIQSFGEKVEKLIQQGGVFALTKPFPMESILKILKSVASK